jgi:MFS family permease
VNTKHFMPIYFTFTLVLLCFTSMHGSRVLLTLYALKLGAQPLAVGILAATFSALPMLLSWQVGKLADRFGSRWTLTFGAAGGACGMLLPYFSPGLPVLYIAGTMVGLFIAFCGVSLQNLVGLQSTSQNRALNYSNFSMMVSAGVFFGPLLAGFSIDHLGHVAAFFYLVLLSLMPVVMLTIWGDVLPRGSRNAPQVAKFRDMLTGPGLWRVLATSSLVMTGFALFQFYMPVYGNSIGLSASAIGVVLAMYSVAGFIVRLFLPLLIARLGDGKVLAYSFFFAALGLTLAPFFKSYVTLTLISFVFGLGMGCGGPITIMMAFDSSAKGRSGEILGVRIAINHLTGLIVPVVFGAIGSAFGVSPVFWLNALMLVSGGMISKSVKVEHDRK